MEVDKPEIETHHGVEDFPTLVFYKNEIPAVYEGDLVDNEEVLEWVISLVEGMVHAIFKFLNRKFPPLTQLFEQFLYEKCTYNIYEKCTYNIVV